MVTHIVYWTLKPEAEGNKAEENARIMKQKLDDLKGKIPSLLAISVGIQILPTTTEEVQIILVSTHDDAKGLKAYAEHPLHLGVAAFIKEVVASRKAIDFES